MSQVGHGAAYDDRSCDNPADPARGHGRRVSTSERPAARPDSQETRPIARVDADHNLLLGLLALQNNFIDRDALLDAFSRWVHDRAVPIGRILQDRGPLKPDEHELLQALVGKHLERFGGDPEKSLEHLSSIGSVREDLSRIADADLHVSLAMSLRPARMTTRIAPSLRRAWANPRPPAAGSASSAPMPGAA